jgi:hypothetical protein
MKSVQRIAIGVAAVWVSASALLACQDDDTVGQGATNPDMMNAQPDATATTTEEPDGSTTPAVDGSAADGSAADASVAADASDAGSSPATGDAGVVSCAAYCSAIAAACTGNNAQYLSNDECMTACALLPLGTSGATTGNSVACRITHAGYAAMGTTNPHCWHAGPFGYGGCGDECDDFCLLATSFCSVAGGFDAGAPPYASTSACSTACAGFTKIDDVGGGGTFAIDGGYNAAGPSGGNTLDCREWHLDNALAGPGSSTGQELHCNHVGATSPTCN